MKTYSVYLKKIFFGIVIILSIIGLFSTLSFFGSLLSRHTEDGILVNNEPNQINKSKSKTDNSNDNIDNDFRLSSSIILKGSNYSIMEVMVKGGNSNSLYKRAGINNYYFINALFYNQKTGSYKLLFDKKVILLNPFPGIGENDSSNSKIFFLAVSENTDGDKYLTENDNHILFSCEKDGSNLKQITDSKLSVEDYKYLDKTNLLITVLKPEKDKPKEKWERSYLQYDLTKEKIIRDNIYNLSFDKAIEIFNK